MQKQRHKGRLSVCGHQGVDLILYGLDPGAQLVLKSHLHDFFLCVPIQAAAELFFQLQGKLFPAFSQVFAQMLNVHGLPPVLVAGHGRYDLCGNRAGHLETLG